MHVALTPWLPSAAAVRVERGSGKHVRLLGNHLPQLVRPLNNRHVQSQPSSDTHGRTTNIDYMLCYVMLCYVMLCYAVTLRYVTLRYVTLRYVTLCYVVLYYVMLHVNQPWVSDDESQVN